MTASLPQTGQEAHGGGLRSKTTSKVRVLSTHKQRAGLPVTRMLGFSNKINNKINLITIIYRYSYIHILQSAISPIGEEQERSAAAGACD